MLDSLRHAWRALRRTPAFTVTAILTLVIGIGATAAIFAVVNGVLLRPLPYGDPERLVGAWHDLPPVSIRRANQTSAMYFTYKDLARSIEGIAIYQEGAANVADPASGTEPQRLASAWISASLVPVLQVRPLLGRSFTEAEDLPNGPRVVVISDALWRARFGADRGVIGRTMQVNGESREIVGVMPERFRFPTAATQLWLPRALDPHDPFPGGFSYNSIARLKPGITIQAAQRDFAAVLPRVVERSPQLAPGVPMQMLLDQAKPVPVLSAMHEDVTGDIARTLWMVAAAAALVLLAACFNVANLTLVRADSRQRELAVREALGAGRARVLGHFLAESAVVAGIAAVLGLGVAWASVRALVAAAPSGIPRLAEVGVDATVVGFTLAVSALAALVCSAIPALRIGRAMLANALREGGRTGTAGRVQHRVRGALVAAQIALALVVLTGSGLLLRSYQRLSAIEPGFDADQVATLWMSPSGTRYPNDSAVVRFYEALTERVARLPGVRRVGLTSRLPLLGEGMNLNPFYAEGDAAAERKIPPLQIYTTVDSGYFGAMRIPLLAGRNFDRIGRQREYEAIVSRRTAEQFWKEPAQAIGKRFRSLPTGPWFTVIGVVGDARDTALAAPPTQTTYFPQSVVRDQQYSQVRGTMALVLRTPGDPAAVIPAAQKVVRELDPALPTFDVRTMRAVMERSTARLSFIITILGAAAGVTLLLGAIGLYGVMAYLVTLRTRELGVRIALGAAPRAVAAMMTKQGLTLTAVGVAGGLGLFLLIARFLRSFLYDVAPTDPLTLLAASVVLAGIAGLASWIPARRASRVDPASSLRAE